IEAAGGSIEE
ncbi:50S ribosomal protein L15, partial [Haemophilus influenzae]